MPRKFKNAIRGHLDDKDKAFRSALERQYAKLNVV
jgi:hypothetical protein